MRREADVTGNTAPRSATPRQRPDVTGVAYDAGMSSSPRKPSLVSRLLLKALGPVTALAGRYTAGGGPTMLEAGMQAPDFEVQDHTGKRQRLSDYRGKDVVLWFYPRADTPG
jgi:hypothetical protein